MKKIFSLVFVLALATSLWATQHVVQPGNTALAYMVVTEPTVLNGDTLVLKTGEYVEPWSFAIQNKENLTIMAANGEKPVIKASSYMEIHTGVTFNGIKFDGTSNAEYATYSKGTSPKNIIFKNCEFINYTKYCLSSSSSAHTDSIIINNCFFHDNTGVSALYLPEGGSADVCDYISITNTTICNMGTNGGSAGVIDVREKTKEANNMKLIVDHVTIYNLASTYERIIQSYKSHNVTISNSIIAQPSASTSQYPTYLYGGDVTNCLTYNLHSHKSTATCTGNLTGDPAFNDPANLDFSLQKGSPAIKAGTDGKDLGDLRWSKKEEDDPIVITVDGDAKDWAGVPMLTEPGSYPIIRAIPTTAANLAMYYMYQDTAIFADSDFPKLYVDADSDPSTGTKLSSAYVNFGYDYNFTSGYGSWTSFNMSTSEHVMEIAIDKAAMPTAVVPFTSVFEWYDTNWTKKWIYPIKPADYGWSFGEAAYHPVTIKNFQIADLNGEHTAAASYARFAYMQPGDSANFYSNGTSKDTLSWISWPVNLTKSAKYAVSADVTSSNDVSCYLYLYDMATNQLVEQFGTGQTSPAALEEAGIWDLSNVPAGKYMLVMRNKVKHSKMKMYSVSLTYQGGTVIELPDELLPVDALLSDHSFVDNDSIIFYDRGAEGNTPLGWAKWNVKVTTKAKYAFTANICSSNGHQFQVSVIGADTMYQNSVKSYATGDKAMDLGYTILEPGNYTIMMRNVMEHSKGRLMSVVVNKSDLPTAVTISEEATDNSVLMSNQNTPLAITLTRSLTAGMFNTLCLPFALSADEISASDLAGAEICALEKTTLTGDSVTFFFQKVTAMEAGVPYIIQPTAAVTNPTFEDATITKVAPSNTDADHATFKGTFTTTHLQAGNENLLYLGQNNTLYFPNENDTESMNGLRAYFEIKQAPGAPIRRASIHMGTNVITTLDLVDGKAIPEGKFMLNGQIIIRANGQDYLLDGSRR